MVFAVVCSTLDRMRLPVVNCCTGHALVNFCTRHAFFFFFSILSFILSEL